MTDFIIETAHEAAAVAQYSRRQKLKLDDFKFALRKDEAKLGRVHSLLHKDKRIAEEKKEHAINDEAAQAEKYGGEEGPEGKGRRKRKRKERDN